ncbi:MAG: hypothetical protein JNN12_17200 [Bacteroidetes Order II. Incertae sedis bacterium]|nr:hypothetical protein [Bacteroidetes Order II. bacterium]
MNENNFLNALTNSFKAFLETGSRSNEKLKILHSFISKDIINIIGTDYIVKSLNIGDGKEGSIQGRYINKNVDIVILQKNKVIAGIGVKFVMQNYSQNSNNYFENMLGETANIRSNNIPYFQIFVIPEKMPYYKSSGQWDKWEEFSLHNSKKYNILSEDNVDNFLHTPTKTLLYVVKLPEINFAISTKDEYYDFYRNYQNLRIEKSTRNYGSFSNSVIHNDYVSYINKICNYIKSI